MLASTYIQDAFFDSVDLQNKQLYLFLAFLLISRHLDDSLQLSSFFRDSLLCFILSYKVF